MIKNIVKDLYPYKYGIVSEGNDKAIKIFKKYLNFKIDEFEANSEHNGWVIPNGQIINKAIIKFKGKVIYDAMNMPLGTISLCAPFKGKLSLSDLKKHLHYNVNDKNALVFHFAQYYRPSNKKYWGFCVTKKFYDSLKKGDYEVIIDIKKYKSTMKVMHYTLKGKSSKTIIINAHNCHPYQANDNISGCAVGIELLKKLSTIKNRYFSYTLLIAPELIGPIFWLNNKRNIKNFIGAIKLASVGNKAKLKLQYSFNKDSALDKCSNFVFLSKYKKFVDGNFREVYGNDETVFDAANIEIPTITLTRYPWKYYHSDKDKPDTISEKMLQDTLDTCFKILKINEQNIKYKFTKKGLICLSNEKYNLYIKAFDPSDKFGPKSRQENRKYYMLMTLAPRLLNGSIDMIDLSKKFNIDFNFIKEYFYKWYKKKLLKIIR